MFFLQLMEAKINLAMLNNNKCSSVEFDGSNISSTHFNNNGNGHLEPTIVSAVTVASSPSLTHKPSMLRLVSESTVHVPVRPIEHRQVCIYFSSKHGCPRGKKCTFLHEQSPATVRNDLPQWYTCQ